MEDGRCSFLFLFLVTDAKCLSVVFGLEEAVDEEFSQGALGDQVCGVHVVCDFEVTDRGV